MDLKLEADRLKCAIGQKVIFYPIALHHSLDGAHDPEYHVGDDEYDDDDGGVLDKDSGRKGAVATTTRAGLTVHHVPAGVIVVSSSAHVTLLLKASSRFLLEMLQGQGWLLPQYGFDWRKISSLHDH